MTSPFGWRNWRGMVFQAKFISSVTARSFCGLACACAASGAAIVVAEKSTTTHVIARLHVIRKPLSRLIFWAPLLFHSVRLSPAAEHPMARAKSRHN